MNREYELGFSDLADFLTKSGRPSVIASDNTSVITAFLCRRAIGLAGEDYPVHFFSCRLKPSELYKMHINKLTGYSSSSMFFEEIKTNLHVYEGLENDINGLCNKIRKIKQEADEKSKNAGSHRTGEVLIFIDGVDYISDNSNEVSHKIAELHRCARLNEVIMICAMKRDAGNAENPQATWAKDLQDYAHPILSLTLQDKEILIEVIDASGGVKNSHSIPYDPETHLIEHY